MVKICVGILSLLCLCLVCFSEQGGYIQHRRAVQRAAQGPASGDPCTSCTNETYEGTGTAVAGWLYGDNTAGVVTNVDYATAPAPLSGSQSYLIRNPSFQTGYSYINMPNATEVWFRFIFTITNTIVNNMRMVIIADSGFTEQASVQVQSSGLRIVVGTANATTVSTLTAGTKYYCWGHYKKGTGANAVGDIEFSTSKTRLGSGNGFAQTTTGSSTANAQQIGPYVNDVSFGSGIMGCIYDDFSLTTLSQPGDFP